jgi:hypothetical protein
VKSATHKLVRSIGLELPIHPVQRARRLGIGHGGAHRLASPCTAQPGQTHQPLDGTARNDQALAVQLAPDLVGAVDLQVLVEHTLHLGQQQGIALGPLLAAAQDCAGALHGTGTPTGRPAALCRSARPRNERGARR